MRVVQAVTDSRARNAWVGGFQTAVVSLAVRSLS
jgi:hypothetical protein